jgi:hypothetical protein
MLQSGETDVDQQWTEKVKYLAGAEWANEENLARST